MEGKPPPNFFDAFDYTVGPLVGEGGWATFTGKGSPAVSAPGTVHVYPGDIGAIHDVAFVGISFRQAWSLEVTVFWPAAATGSGGNYDFWIVGGIFTFHLVVNAVDAATGEIEVFQAPFAGGSAFIPKDATAKLRFDAPGDGTVHCYVDTFEANVIDISAATDFPITEVRIAGAISPAKAFDINAIYFGPSLGVPT